MVPTAAVAKRFLSGVSLLGMTLIGSLPSHQCETSWKLEVTAVPVSFSVREQYLTTELFSRLIERHHWQEAHLDRVRVVRTYKVENEKGKTLAEEVAVMEYTAPGTEIFTAISEKGSGFIRQRVFERLMKDEEKRAGAKKDPDSLITPENYTLDIIGKDRIDSSDCLIVHAIPIRKETDLFEGKIWIDSQDFAIVKITGHLAKSPSFWIKHVDFVRDYQKIDRFWLLSREKAVSAVRIYGKETLTIDYQDYIVSGVEAVQPLPTNAAGVRLDRYRRHIVDLGSSPRHSAHACLTSPIPACL